MDCGLIVEILSKDSIREGGWSVSSESDVARSRHRQDSDGQ